jgi:hypothetical protein
VTPAEAVTCTPVGSAPLTDLIGSATWACTTGATGMEAVTIKVEAPNPLSSECHFLLSKVFQSFLKRLPVFSQKSLVKPRGCGFRVWGLGFF